MVVLTSLSSIVVELESRKASLPPNVHLEVLDESHEQHLTQQLARAHVLLGQPNLVQHHMHVSPHRTHTPSTHTHRTHCGAHSAAAQSARALLLSLSPLLFPSLMMRARSLSPSLSPCVPLCAVQLAVELQWVQLIFAGIDKAVGFVDLRQVKVGHQPGLPALLRHCSATIRQRG